MSAANDSGRGRFITFEGIDGAGKSSHMAQLAQWLRGRERRVLLTREPGGTPLAELIRETVLQRPMDALSEALLVFAARRDHVVGVIEPALARGDDVLCDRFTDASFAYQGGGRGLPTEVLRTLESWVHPGLQPDLTLWFDLAAQEAAARRAAARAPDRFEQQDLAFFTRVRRAYDERAQADPCRVVRIDASPAPNVVWQLIENALKRQGWW